MEGNLIGLIPGKDAVTLRRPASDAQRIDVAMARNRFLPVHLGYEKEA